MNYVCWYTWIFHVWEQIKLPEILEAENLPLYNVAHDCETQTKSLLLHSLKFPGFVYMSNCTIAWKCMRQSNDSSLSLLDNFCLFSKPRWTFFSLRILKITTSVCSRCSWTKEMRLYKMRWLRVWKLLQFGKLFFYIHIVV